MRIINWGILGTGAIAYKFAAALNHVEQCKIYAVGSRNIDRAREFSNRYGTERYYGSYEELASDINVDIIYIATPHVFHCKNTLLCLTNNKAVLCEKPFAMNEDEVQKMISLAKAKNLFLMEAFWTRFLPSILKVQEIIQNNIIGDIIQLHSNLGFKVEYNPESRWFNKKLGGGCLLDIGVYPVFISLLLLGIPEEIESHATFCETGADDSVQMTFRYNKAIANLHCSFNENTSLETNIIGTKGTITINKPWHSLTYLTVNLIEGKHEDYYFDYTSDSGYEYEAKEIIRCLLNGKTESSLFPHDLSIKLIRIIDKIKNENKIEY